MNSIHTINIRGEIIDLASPKVMGIINLTPDSFFSESRKFTIDGVLKNAEEMLSQGASFLDMGGYSSRPGAEDISVDEELTRVVKPIEEVVRRFPEASVSVDTFRAKVAEEAVSAGAAMINDISAGHLDEAMLLTVAQCGVPYVAMHMRGTPQTMNDHTIYDDVLMDVIKYFSERLENYNRIGIKDVIIDPGLGFAKTAKQSFDLLNRLDHFHHLSRPLLVGVSRKSMIYRTLNSTAKEALNGTSVLNTVALIKGARILRVHDVKEAVEAIKLITELG